MDAKGHDAKSLRILNRGSRWLMVGQEVKGGRQGQKIGRLRKRYLS